MNTSDWINLGVALITLLGTTVALVALWLQIRKMNQQMMIQQFSDYTKRYQEIILRFPEDISKSSFKVQDHKNYESLMRNMRTYFDLCFEEWYLNNRKLIDSDIWCIWEGGMKTALSKSAFQQSWSIILKDTNFGQGFEEFIDNLIHTTS